LSYRRKGVPPCCEYLLDYSLFIDYHSWHGDR